jgi:ABC-type multidrug transport system fused ATPase/permease subunit
LLYIFLLPIRKFRVLAQLEFDFNSIERIGEYLTVEQEAPALIPEYRPPAYWPSSSYYSSSAVGIVDNGTTVGSGDIVVDNLYIRYSLTSLDVLHGITFTVRAGEKIGVVGRTGSGKTTLCAAFLRVIEARSGRIM